MVVNNARNRSLIVSYNARNRSLIVSYNAQSHNYWRICFVIKETKIELHILRWKFIDYCWNDNFKYFSIFCVSIFYFIVVGVRGLDS